MPDAINNEGLQLKTLTEIREELVAAMKDIYGADINVDQNSPDGQMINIFAQAAVDTRELLQTIHNNFDPDQAQGVVLDQRVSINGIVRKDATYTIVPITITVDKPVGLPGLDHFNIYNNGLFTVKDEDGNEFYLIDSVVFREYQSYSGKHYLGEKYYLDENGRGEVTVLFRAKEIGNIEVKAGSINSVVTVFNGVTGVENPGGASTQGQDEETDAQLKLRRRQAISIGATGSLDSISSNIANLDNVAAVEVYENDTDETHYGGIPAHSIWVIVDGGDDDEIAQVIYSTKTAGTGMKGSEHGRATRSTGGVFIAHFDRPKLTKLYIRLNVYQYTHHSRPDIPINETQVTRLKTLIAENLIWRMGQSPGADDIISFIKNKHPRYIIKNVKVASSSIDSDVPGTYEEVVNPEYANSLFINSVDRISINPDLGDTDE